MTKFKYILPLSLATVSIPIVAVACSQNTDTDDKKIETKDNSEVNVVVKSISTEEVQKADFEAVFRVTISGNEFTKLVDDKKTNQDIVNSFFSYVSDSSEYKALKLSQNWVANVTKSESTYVVTYNVPKANDFSTVDLNTLGVEKPSFSINIEESEVDSKLNDFIESHTKFVIEKNPEYLAVLGDRVKLSFVGKVDGVEFEGGKSESTDLILGSKSFIGNFEEQLVGLKVGDKKVVNVKFPDNYRATNLAGKDAAFDVVILEIAKLTKPTLNFEFFKSETNYVTFTSADDLKKIFKRQSQYSKLQKSLEAFYGLVVNKIWGENSDFKYSKTELKNEITGLKNSFINRLRQNGQTLQNYLMFVNQTEEQFDAETDSTARENIKYQEISNYLFNKFNITISDEEFNKYFLLMSQINGVSEEIIKTQVNSRKESYTYTLKLEKAKLEVLKLIYPEQEEEFKRLVSEIISN